MPEPSPNPPYAGFWIRLLAFLVDNVILLLILTVLGVVFALLGDSAAAAFSAAFILAPILYWGAMHASAREATFGKALLGMKVLASDSGERISMLRSIGREFAKFVSMLPMMIGFLMAGFTSRKQALHDYIASTVVVRESRGHVVAALAVCVLAMAAPVVVVAGFGVGMFAGLMGGLWGEMKELQKQLPPVPAPPAPPATKA